MRNLFILILFLNAARSNAQYASFSADAFRYSDPADTNDSHWNYINQMQWIINDRQLRWNSDTIFVPVDDIMDTIFFRQDEDHDFDTIICNIRFAQHYDFLYNPCCGGFNVTSKEGIGWGSVKFEVTNRSSKNYVGQVHETGMIVQKDSVNIISPQCISAMAMNTYYVALHEFRYCSYDNPACTDSSWIACLQEYNHWSAIDSITQFATTNTICRFIYMPLSTEPLQINYDAKTKKTTLF